MKGTVSVGVSAFDSARIIDCPRDGASFAFPRRRRDPATSSCNSISRYAEVAGDGVYGVLLAESQLTSGSRTDRNRFRPNCNRLVSVSFLSRVASTFAYCSSRLIAVSATTRNSWEALEYKRRETTAESACERSIRMQIAREDHHPHGTRSVLIALPWARQEGPPSLSLSPCFSLLSRTAAPARVGSRR